MSNKAARNVPIDDIQEAIELKTKLQMFIKSAKSPFSHKFIKAKLEIIEKKISQLTAKRNADTVSDQLKILETTEGSFSQTGMWKVKSKLFPRPSDPPMAKKDFHGNIITSQEALKKLYLDTYIQRLEHREMKNDFNEIHQLKSQLWKERLKLVKTNISNDWKMEELDCVIKKLKRNLTCDPNGMIKEIFFPNVMGSDLKLGLLNLVNGIKREIFFHKYMQLANISTIYKNIAFARGGAHLPIAHALRLLSTKELRFGLTKLNLRTNNFLK